MQITINDHRKILTIQREFSKKFPYLKIEFFSKPHSSGSASSRKLMLPDSKTLGECRVIQRDGIINITPTMTVAELEQKFAKEYGLSIQLFRRSGKAWLETTVTDGWTLEKQNKQGEEITNFSSHRKSSEENEAAE